MSRLSELIRDLCPDGVDKRPLGELLAYTQPGPYLVSSKKYSPRFPTPVLTAGTTFLLGYSRETDGVYEASKSNPVIIFDDFTTDSKWVDFPFKLKSSAAKILTLANSELADIRFLFYSLQTIRYEAGTHSRHWISRFAKMPVFCPPLEVQREIVRILDQFTALEAELEAELEARRKQYEYYREQLMREAAICETRALSDISVTIRSGGTPRSNNASYYNGVVPWLRTQDIDFCDIWETSASITEEGLCNSSAKWVPIGCVIIAMYGATAAKVAMNRIPLTMNQACCAFEIDDSKAVARYVYHWIASQYVTLRSQGEGSQNNLSVGKLKKVQIPLPSIYEQRRIADILDRFDALVNDISFGLPAELEARRKQYEHYRDRLLFFPEKEA